MLQPLFTAAVSEKAVDVLRHQIILVIGPKAIELCEYSGELLVKGQRQAPKLWRQRLLGVGEVADGLGREDPLERSICSLKMGKAPLVRRGVGDLGDEARGILPVQENALAKATSCVDLNCHRLATIAAGLAGGQDQ